MSRVAEADDFGDLLDVVRAELASAPLSWAEERRAEIRANVARLRGREVRAEREPVHVSSLMDAFFAQRECRLDGALDGLGSLPDSYDEGEVA